MPTKCGELYGSKYEYCSIGEAISSEIHNQICDEDANYHSKQFIEIQAEVVNNAASFVHHHFSCNLQDGDQLSLPSLADIGSERVHLPVLPPRIDRDGLRMGCLTNPLPACMQFQDPDTPDVKAANHSIAFPRRTDHQTCQPFSLQEETSPSPIDNENNHNAILLLLTCWLLCSLAMNPFFPKPRQGEEIKREIKREPSCSVTPDVIDEVVPCPAPRKCKGNIQSEAKQVASHRGGCWHCHSTSRRFDQLRECHRSR